MDRQNLAVFRKAELLGYRRIGGCLGAHLEQLDGIFRPGIAGPPANSEEPSKASVEIGTRRERALSGATCEAPLLYQRNHRLAYGSFAHAKRAAQFAFGGQLLTGLPGSISQAA